MPNPQFTQTFIAQTLNGLTFSASGPNVLIASRSPDVVQLLIGKDQKIVRWLRQFAKSKSYNSSEPVSRRINFFDEPDTVVGVSFFRESRRRRADVRNPVVPFDKTLQAQIIALLAAAVREAYFGESADTMSNVEGLVFVAVLRPTEQNAFSDELPGKLLAELTVALQGYRVQRASVIDAPVAPGWMLTTQVVEKRR